MIGMKRIGAFLLLAPLAVGGFGCGTTHGREVVAIPKTKTYHRAVCPPVHMARTLVVTVEEAHSMKLRPCLLCQPDSI